MNLIREGLSPDEKGLPRIVRVVSLLRLSLNLLMEYVFVGSGDPATMEPNAPKASIYLRTDTGKLYVKEAGGWAVK